MHKSSAQTCQISLIALALVPQLQISYLEHLHLNVNTVHQRLRDVFLGARHIVEEQVYRLAGTSE